MNDETANQQPQQTPEIKLSRSAVAAQKRAKELADKLKKLKEQVAEVESAKKAKEALFEKLKSESTTTSKELRRQQSLIGAMIMSDMKSDKNLKEKIFDRLKTFYTREREQKALDSLLNPKAEVSEDNKP